MGRKGNRKGGRPKQTADQKARAALERAKPNPRCQARQDRFRHFGGETGQGHEMTCAGRLMLVGAFDGMDATPEVILSGLLAYANGYWGNYPGGPLMRDYEAEVKGGTNDNGDDRRGRWFEMIDTILRSEGYAVRQAVQAITVDRHWFPDEDIDWAARIINSRVLQKRDGFVRKGQAVPPELAIAGELACDSDWAMLELAKRGAAALAGVTARKKAA